jgi:hypothetical protein
MVEEVVKGWSKVVQNYNHMTLCGDASMMSSLNISKVNNKYHVILNDLRVVHRAHVAFLD